MNRQPVAIDGAGFHPGGSPHRTLYLPVFARASKLRRAITMTNRKCIHVR